MQKDVRIFCIREYVRPSLGEPIRSIVLESDDSAVVVWHAHPGQEIAPHIHPDGQDTWTVISGEAEYYCGNGETFRVQVGDIAIAKPNQVHGAKNIGSEPFVFVSVVASGKAGFALAKK